MKPIISKRHIFKFYLSIIFATLFYLGMAIVLLFVYQKQAGKGNVSTKTIILPIISISFCVFAGYSLYRYFKNAPNITIDNDFIHFNNQTLPLTDIVKVELTGKRPFRYAINFPMEAATLTFNTGVTKYIFDDMYSNSWKIKSFLKQFVIDKKEFIVPTENAIDANSLNSEFFETYKGNVITSLRGIVLWGSLGFSGYIFFTSSKPISTGIVVGLFCLYSFWFLFHTYLLNYFQISDNYLIVRNHNLFWRKKAYRLSDIKEVVFETKAKMPNCLRVITKNFKNKLYPAATLRKNHWLALKGKLESHSITVRNECIY